ncbi:MAG TPA: 4-hydroxythreonine-4-phosphate dehydrogenase PdxA [Blastocatellia bacterium]|nr:4-hydroxythreonine-4-phosphate dehydrogenase PdxA [Blastocatellia bacterium]
MTPSSHNPDLPRIAVTAGDPAGIGPEIVLKSVADAEVRTACQAIIIADATELHRQAARLGLPCDYRVVSDSELDEASAEQVLICDVKCINEPVAWGRVSRDGARAAIASIGRAARLALAGRADAMATAPINKEALRLAGSPYPGHTEMLASICGAEDVLMCFFAGNLRVVLLTIHMSLASAIKAVTRPRIVKALRLTHSELKRFGIGKPRIAVAGLNPHASEHGLFGSEEAREIEPAIEECRASYGIDVSGPFPADTLFVRAWRGEFDAVAACYHDQGLIAVKCLSFGKAVNVTLGLPIVRTSVDHGTAFDIAGRGVADHSSMVEAIKLAARLARTAGGN